MLWADSNSLFLNPSHCPISVKCGGRRCLILHLFSLHSLVEDGLTDFASVKNIGEKLFLQSPLAQGSSIDRLWGFCSGWSIFDLNWCLGTPHFTHNICYPVIWVCISELVGGACDLYHIVLRWTRWYHARLYKLTDQFASRSKYARLNPAAARTIFFPS